MAGNEINQILKDYNESYGNEGGGEVARGMANAGRHQKEIAVAGAVAVGTAVDAATTGNPVKEVGELGLKGIWQGVKRFLSTKKDDAAKKAANTVGDAVPKSQREMVELHRAVSPEELADIKKNDTFSNPQGIENKYFTDTEANAREFAKKAENKFKDEKKTVVRTTIPKDQITPEMDFRKTSDIPGGLPTLTVPTDKLDVLSPPEILD